jgi:hypothetical protein
MQQIKIKILGAETGEARFTSARHAIAAHLVCFHFGDHKYAVTLTGNNATDQFLGTSVAVIPGRID